MSVARDQVREIVREELAKKLAARDATSHPALLLLHLPEDDSTELDPGRARPCVIEPDRPCYRSGYCKRLGY